MKDTRQGRKSWKGGGEEERKEQAAACTGARTRHTRTYTRRREGGMEVGCEAITRTGTLWASRRAGTFPPGNTRPWPLGFRSCLTAWPDLHVPRFLTCITGEVQPSVYAPSRVGCGLPSHLIEAIKLVHSRRARSPATSARIHGTLCHLAAQKMKGDRTARRNRQRPPMERTHAALGSDMQQQRGDGGQRGKYRKMSHGKVKDIAWALGTSAEKKRKREPARLGIRRNSPAAQQRRSGSMRGGRSCAPRGPWAAPPVLGRFAVAPLVAAVPAGRASSALGARRAEASIGVCVVS